MILATAVRIGDKDGQSALIAALENRDTDKHQVLLPNDDFSRVFVTFPGEDIRSELLHNEMTEALAAPGCESANALVSELLKDEYTKVQAVDRILDQLAEVLPNDNQFDKDTGLPALCASARLAVYLAKNDDVQRIRKCPLLTADDSIVRLSGPGQQILAPVLHWPSSAQHYADLYGKARLLSDRYCDDDGLASALNQLIEVELVIAAPLFEGRRALIEDANLLREMSQGKQDIAGMTVRNASFGQIAFLTTDLVQRCGQDADLAKRLLGFVLNVAASEDQSWRKTETVAGNRSGERVDISLSGATWPFELKVRSWIPVTRPDEEGIAPMPANESNLRDILEPSWLKGNRTAVDLLHQIFGFRQLTLMLDSLEDEIENTLVELLEDPELIKAATTNPDTVKFASELETADITLDSVREFVRDTEEDKGLVEYLAKRREQRRRVQDNQNLGGSVESLVKESLEQAGFSVHRTWVGADFEIAADLGDVANMELTRGDQSWLVEVKSTRDWRVRMTDTQARKAVEEGSRFLLCVVPVEQESSNPEADDIRTNMRFVAGIGDRVATLCNELGNFEDIHSDITSDKSDGVQLEITPGAARVRVASSVWENDGFPLDELAGHLAGTLS